MLVSRYAASVPPSGTGSAVVGAASGIGSASADESNHGVGLSAAGWALGHGTAVGCGRTPGHGTAAAHGRGLPAAGEHPATGGGCRLRVGTQPQGGGHRLHGRTAAGGHPATGRDCRLRAGPPTAARSATNRLSTARTSTMPKTRMNPFTPTFPRYCTVIGFICYVTNI